MVAPDLQGMGLGRWMLEQAQAAAPPDARSIGVITGARSEGNLRMYRRAGFRPLREQPDPRLARLSKPRR
jgi:tRNA (guanine37-N1)-methyltransferase